ncbi:ThiF family adenylyltransferase [Tateyamaria sp.]|uniref:ThiF family adenylyltransferase n=1 Tax=Tateyamaria sp. TaxID=1929288 RepID=UPI003B2264D0
MDGSTDTFEDEDVYIDIGGEPVSSDQLKDRLAQSLFDFVSNYGGHTAKIEELRQLEGGIDVIILVVTTCISQEPKFDVLPEERLAVMFIEEAPAVVPLRTDFPLTPHSYGLPVGSVLPGSMTICTDDRPWEDAKAEYSGAEIVRRIISWFGRVDSGDIDDALQLPHTIFLPAEQTIVMRTDLQAQLCTLNGPPVHLRLSFLGDSDKLLMADGYDVAAPSPPAPGAMRPFIGFTLGVRAQNSGAMWHRPGHLGDLRYMLSGGQDDLLDLLRTKLSDLMAEADQHIQQLYGSHLLIQLIVINEDHDGIEPMFLGTEASLGEIGVALGLLFETPGEVAHSYGRSLAIGEIDESRAESIRLMAANLCSAFDGEVASIYAGHDDDWRDAMGKKAVVLGAGSIGSQCVTSLVREGAFEELTLVDDDLFAPHNLARHTLRGPALGMLKITHLSDELREIRSDLSIKTIAEKLGSSLPSDALATALQDSDRILDMTASLGASRTLCAMPVRSRATSAFFNPSGTSVAVLHEDTNSVLDLATLEALYYAEIVHNASLHEHLRPGDEAVVSGGQCRSVTSRIPASRAAILSSVAASVLGDTFRSPDPAIIIASIDDTGATQMHRTQLEGTRSHLDADGVANKRYVRSM